MKLIEMAEKLRDGRINFYTAIYSKVIPDSILHHFGCDCAERALKGNKGFITESQQASWEAVKVKRRWIDGLVGDEELDEARETAHRAAYQAEDWGSNKAACKSAYMTTHVEVYIAVSWTAEDAAESAEHRAANSEEYEEAYNEEREWQRNHLADLIEEYLSEKSLFLSLLSRRSIQLRKQEEISIPLWQVETEEIFYET